MGEAPTDDGCRDPFRLASSKRPERGLTTGQRQGRRASDVLSGTTQRAAYPLRQNESPRDPLLAETKIGKEANQVGIAHLAIMIEIFSTGPRTRPPDGQHAENVRKPHAAILIQIFGTLALLKDTVLVAVLMVKLTHIKDPVAITIAFVHFRLIRHPIAVAVVEPASKSS